MGALEIGQASPYVEAFSMAKGAAAIIFAIIDRQPTIDSSSSEGLKPESAKGRIQLQDVKFHYPSRWGIGACVSMCLCVPVHVCLCVSWCSCVCLCVPWCACVCLCLCACLWLSRRGLTLLSRVDVPILQGLNLTIEPGQTVIQGLLE